MTDYATDWVARRAMIAHAETSQWSKAIKNPIAHTNKMVKRYGSIYKEAYGAAYGARRPDRCAAQVQNAIDIELSARHGWVTIQDCSARDLAMFKACYGQKEYDL